MISTRSLIQLCHRVGTAVKSGIDARRVWEMEERHASGPLKTALGAIRQQVARGGTVAEGMQAADGYFPPMFVQMVAIGEQTGKLDEVLHRLAEHYEHLATMRRTFWIGIAWPLFELVFAVLVIGAVIFITGHHRLGQRRRSRRTCSAGASSARAGRSSGSSSAASSPAASRCFAHAITRGWLGPQPMLLAMRIPVLGKCLESLALSRLTWSLALALDSGMDARRAVELSIRAAQNPSTNRRCRG